MPQPISFFPTDLATDLDPLSMEDRGIYLTFIRHSWPYGGPMPIDEVEALIGKPWLSIGFLLRRRFVELDGKIHLEWVEVARQKAMLYSEQQSAKGKLGGRPSKGKKLRLNHRKANEKPLKSPRVGNGIGIGNGLGIEERKAAFAQACKVAVEADPDRIDADEKAAFYGYWTETDAKGKMRFEGQDFFDHGRRMDTWMRNKAKREGPKPEVGAPWNPRA